MADAYDAFAWFPLLAKRHDEKMPRILRLRGYAFRNEQLPPRPEGGKRTRASWQTEQLKALAPWGGLVVDSAAQRIRIAGCTVGESGGEAETLARRIMRNNNIEAVLAEAVQNALNDGQAYLLPARDAFGRALITADDELSVTVALDPAQPWASPRAAMKVYRDLDLSMDFAYVYDGTYRVKFQRPTRNRKAELLTRVSGGGWEPIEIIEVGKVPFVVLRPTPDGRGVFEHVTNTIDRIHHIDLSWLTTMIFQAFKQRWIEGTLPKEDDDGNPYDWPAVFEAGPGAIWGLPEGVKMGESAPTDFRPMLDAHKDSVRDLSALSGTPLASLNPSGENQSAEGAAFQREALINRVQSYLNRLQPAIELAIVRAINIERPGLLTEADTVTVAFMPPNRISESELMNALVMAKAADVPWRTRMLTIGGFSQDDVDRMQLERDMDQLQLQAILAVADPAASAEEVAPAA